MARPGSDAIKALYALLVLFLGHLGEKGGTKWKGDGMERKGTGGKKRVLTIWVKE